MPYKDLEKKKEYMKEYHQRPEVKEKQNISQKTYKEKPESIQKKDDYTKEYNQRPEVKERKRQYMKLYREKQKELKNNLQTI